MNNKKWWIIGFLAASFLGGIVGGWLRTLPSVNPVPIVEITATVEPSPMLPTATATLSFAELNLQEAHVSVSEADIFSEVGSRAVRATIPFGEVVGVLWFMPVGDTYWAEVITLQGVRGWVPANHLEDVSGYAVITPTPSQ